MTSVYLTHVDHDLSMARFYAMSLQPTLFGEWSLVRERGRIGQSGQVKTVGCNSHGKALEVMVLIAKQKAKRGYIQLSH